MDIPQIHIHCFTDAPEFGQRLLDHFPNLYIGITGACIPPVGRLTKIHGWCPRRDHVFVERKHFEPRSPDVRAVARGATHRPRDGRALHDTREYLRIPASDQGPAAALPYRDDTLDSAVCGGGSGRGVGCRAGVGTRQAQCPPRIWDLSFPAVLELVTIAIAASRTRQCSDVLDDNCDTQ